MTEERLQSGMKVSEAVARAGTWWDLKGRHILKREFNLSRDAPKVGKGFSIAGDVVEVVPSGIFRGLPWSALDKREQVQIVKWWHHFKVVVPDVENPQVSAEDRDTLKRWGIQ